MTTDSLRNREHELLTYLRNNITDPSSRGTTKQDTFSGTGLLTTFTLSQTGVRNVTSITVTGVPKYIGYDYTIAYGEGSAATTVTFTTAPASGTLNVVINYVYGQSMIYEGFQREDATLPRLAVIFSGASQEFMSIGEDRDAQGGQWVYENASYVIEVRSHYAKEMKDLLNLASNVINQYRQQTPQPYMVVSVYVTSMQSFDFDNELRIYRGQVSFTLRWMRKYK